MPKKYVHELEQLAENWNYPITKMHAPEVLSKLNQDYMTSHCGNVKPQDTCHHFDYYLQRLAEKFNVRTYGLETDSIQIAVINAMYTRSSWKDLKRPIKLWIDAVQVESDDPGLCSRAYQYRAMEMEYDLDQPCTNEVIFRERNDRWMLELPELLRTKRCFVVVGLGHLFNTCGLIQQLRDCGFAVDPVPMHQ